MREYFSSLRAGSFFSQRLLLQDLHDSHVCNSLLVAESEEDLWRSETPFHSRQRVPLPSDGESHSGAFLYRRLLRSWGRTESLTITWSSVPGNTVEKRTEKDHQVWLPRGHQWLVKVLSVETGVGNQRKWKHERILSWRSREALLFQVAWQ